MTNNYFPGSTHIDNSRKIFIEHITPDQLLTLIGAEMPSTHARACEDAQIIKEPAKPSKRQSKKKESKSICQVEELEKMTFVNKKISDPHLTALLAHLVSGEALICEFPEFKRLFEGQRNNCTITWTCNSSTVLVTLFRTMMRRGFIEVPSGFSLVKILEGHFTNDMGEPLTSLGKGNPMSDKYKPLIDECIRILDTDITSLFSEPSAKTHYSRAETLDMRVRSSVKNEDAWADIEG